MEEIHIWQVENGYALTANAAGDVREYVFTTPGDVVSHVQAMLEVDAPRSNENVQALSDEKLCAALKFIFKSGQVDGAHHKAWVIDQITRVLSSDYKAFVSDYCASGEYIWDEGTPP